MFVDFILHDERVNTVQYCERLDQVRKAVCQKRNQNVCARVLSDCTTIPIYIKVTQEIWLGYFSPNLTPSD